MRSARQMRAGVAVQDSRLAKQLPLVIPGDARRPVARLTGLTSSLEAQAPAWLLAFVCVSFLCMDSVFIVVQSYVVLTTLLIFSSISSLPAG